jgi:hypothetical protein
MSLTPTQIEKSKEEARRYLEYSTYTLCLILGVDVDSLSGDMDIPVDADNPQYGSYTCLRSQVAALEIL